MNPLVGLVEKYVTHPSFVVRRGLAGPQGKVGLLVFGKTGTPELYVKVSRFKGPNPGIEKEHANLQQLHQLLPDNSLDESLPEVKFFENSSGRIVLGLSGMTGSPMINEILHRGGKGVEGSLRFLEMGYAWLDEFRRTGWAHGDFCPKNLLVDGDHLNVVDWEYAFPKAAPTFDLFYFSLKFGYWLFGANRKDGREYAFAKTFLEPNWLSRRVKRELDHFPSWRSDFALPLQFQAEHEVECTGITKNFWVDLLDFARQNQSRFL